MITKKPRLLITGLCPDSANTNTRIRDAIVNGAIESELFDRVAVAGIDIVLTHERLDFDFVLAVGSGALDTVPFEILRKRCKASGAFLIFWTHEDPYEFDLNQRIQPLADQFFTNECATLPYYGDEKVNWLPLAADKKYFRNVLPLRDRVIDLFFCGFGYPLRLHILTRIAVEENLSLAFFGPNLKEAIPRVADDRRLSTAEMAETAAHSVLALNVGRDLGIANARLGIVAETPGPRTFDIALSGAPQIIFDDGVVIDHFLDRGREILTFDTVGDIVEAVELLRGEPDRLSNIAEAAQRRVLNMHMYKHRILQMMSML